jgi:enoyl-CoA hydratase/carnithine racemase
LAVGLVSQVLELESFQSGVDRVLQAMAQNSLESLRAIKRGLRAVQSRHEVAWGQAEQEFIDLFQCQDFREGRDAFLQKRPALFPSHISEA